MKLLIECPIALIYLSPHFLFIIAINYCWIHVKYTYYKYKLKQQTIYYFVEQFFYFSQLHIQSLRYIHRWAVRITFTRHSSSIIHWESHQAPSILMTHSLEDKSCALIHVNILVITRQHNTKADLSGEHECIALPFNLAFMSSLVDKSKEEKNRPTTRIYR